VVVRTVADVRGSAAAAARAPRTAGAAGRGDAALGAVGDGDRLLLTLFEKVVPLAPPVPAALRPCTPKRGTQLLRGLRALGPAAATQLAKVPCSFNVAAGGEATRATRTAVRLGPPADGRAGAGACSFSKPTRQAGLTSRLMKSVRQGRG